MHKLKCRDCPYGREDFERRMSWYQKIIAERGIPNDIYGDLTPEEAPDEFEKFLWCDKVGGKVFWAWKCSDRYQEPLIQPPHSKRKKRSRRERDQKYRNHLKSLAENGKWCPCPVTYKDRKWIMGQGYIELRKPYYKRWYRGGSSRYHKKMSNKAIRRYKGEMQNGRWCYKLYDYWWAMY